MRGFIGMLCMLGTPLIGIPNQPVRIEISKFFAGSIHYQNICHSFSRFIIYSIPKKFAKI